MGNEQKIVVPGQEIGTEEEFAAGEGTYADNSLIYAATAGVLVSANRTLSVLAKSAPKNPYTGMKLICKIENIVEPIAIVSPYELQGDKMHRLASNGANMILRASNIKKGYVKNVRDEYKIGDIIRAKIVEIKNGEYQISTDDEDCGCIKAFSSGSEGRHPLEKTAAGLVDIVDEHKENRKMASDYRSINNI